MKEYAQKLVNLGYSVLHKDNMLHAQKNGHVINLIHETVLGNKEYYYGWESFGSIGQKIQVKHLLYKNTIS